MLNNSIPNVDQLLSPLKNRESSESVTKSVEDASTQIEVTTDDIVISSKDLVDCQLKTYCVVLKTGL